MKNKWLKNSNRQHLRYSMRQASGIALALVMGISVAAAGHTQSVKAAVDTQTADTGVVATTDTANQTTETTTIGKNQISIKDFASQVQKVTGKDVLKNAGIKNTAAATHQMWSRKRCRLSPPQAYRKVHPSPVSAGV